MASVGIIGASGYAGVEMIRMVLAHPQLELKVATGDSQAGTPVAQLYPSLAAALPHMVFAPTSPDAVDGCDIVILAMPHGASQSVVPQLAGRAGLIVDLAADFRLPDAELYPKWYGEPHAAPELLSTFTYGLPEVYREALRTATRIAAPGCYPTTANLALWPLAKRGLIDLHPIIVDAACGVSGAGRPPKANTTFCTVDENLEAYGLLTHRHTPEMEMVTGATVLFTPHLAPMNRGILATCYAKPAAGVEMSTELLMAALHDQYDDEPFMVVTDAPPSTKATLGSNTCHVTARYDERTNLVLTLSALDNLVKGTAGQATQCINLAMGWPETQGIAMVGVYP
jgi:N-acetyl-gamma-glutamyl-phosphate reductase